MKQEQLCRLSHYLFILDTYLFQETGREDQWVEIEELQKAINKTLNNNPA